MLLFVFHAIAALSLVSVAQTRQHLMPFNLGDDFCFVAERDSLLALSNSREQREVESCGHQQQGKPLAHTSLWTEKVKCIVNTTDSYCVYNNDEFANGRGISFFTTPVIAKRVASLPVFAQPSLYINANVNNFTNPPWEIRQTPGRGRGLFATRTLHRGDPIMATTPVGVYNSDAIMHDLPLGYAYLHTAFNQLPKPTQQLFLESMTFADGDPIMERVNTNAFLGEFEGANHFLMYPEVARMNHDCRPNAMFYFDPKTLIHATQASRTILPGEEITIPYINILQSRENRQYVLNSSWGFTCSCSLCSSSEKHTHESDSRILRIKHLQNALTDWSRESIGNPSTAEKLIELYEEEGIHAAKGAGHMLAALAFNGLGDTSMAREHAEKALEAGLVSSGNGADEAETKSLLEWPERHWSFMARRK